MGTLRFITIHWTAGGYEATWHNRQFYHLLVDGEAKVHVGFFDPEANIPKWNGLHPHEYAAHCGGGNSYRIGLAACGMLGFKNFKQVGDYPLRRPQCEKLWEATALAAHQYDIPIDAEHVGTHYEFGKTHPKTSSFGKIDIIYLPYKPDLKAMEIGPYIRDKVRWYEKKIL